MKHLFIIFAFAMLLGSFCMTSCIKDDNSKTSNHFFSNEELKWVWWRNLYIGRVFFMDRDEERSTAEYKYTTNTQQDVYDIDADFYTCTYDNHASTEMFFKHASFLSAGITISKKDGVFSINEIHVINAKHSCYLDTINAIKEREKVFNNYEEIYKWKLQSIGSENFNTIWFCKEKGFIKIELNNGEKIELVFLY